MKMSVFKNSILKVKKDSILSMAFILCESGFEIFVPLIMSKLIDFGIEQGNIENVKRYGLMIIALVIGQAVCGALCAYFAVKASTMFAYDIRQNLFNKLQLFSFANIDKFSTGSLVTRSTTDIANIQRAFQMVIRGMIRGIGMFIFSLSLS